MINNELLFQIYQSITEIRELITAGFLEPLSEGQESRIKKMTNSGCPYRLNNLAIALRLVKPKQDYKKLNRYLVEDKKKAGD